MFHSARIKLTAWYLCIIMVVSLLFSIAMYRVIGGELIRFEHIARLRMQRDFGIPPSADPDLIQEALLRLVAILAMINTAIFVGAGLIGYALAGKTLEPIKVMVDEQHRFVADASHELRTPLTAIKSTIEVNLRDKKLTLQSAREVLTSNLEEVNRLQQLSDALLALKPYELPQDSIKKERCSINDIVACAKRKVQPLADKKHITLTINAIDCTLNGDTDALCEAVVILLDNAIKYSPKNSTIGLDTHLEDHAVSISVSDEGPGIAAADLPHLFDRFWRADKSRQSKKTPGYGLGLSIAKKIVELHHGTIMALHKETPGATFIITLPV